MRTYHIINGDHYIFDDGHYTRMVNGYSVEVLTPEEFNLCNTPTNAPTSSKNSDSGTNTSERKKSLTSGEELDQKQRTLKEGRDII